MRLQFRHLSAALPLLAAPSGCTLPLEISDEEAQQVTRAIVVHNTMDGLRNSALLNRLDDLMALPDRPLGKPMGLSKQWLRDSAQLFSSPIQLAGETTRLNAPLIDEAMNLVLKGVGSPQVQLLVPPDLGLQMVDHGLPTLYVDVTSKVFYADVIALRGILVASLLLSNAELDIDAELADLEWITQLERQHRRNVTDPQLAQTFRQQQNSVKHSPAEANDFARRYLQARRALLAMPDDMLLASYQLPSGRIISPGMVAINLYGAELLSGLMTEAAHGAFLTVFLHEVGHLALRHEADIGLSCQRRYFMELEADAYSAIARTTGGLEGRRSFNKSFADAWKTATGGAVPAAGISAFYSVAYPMSGFDRKLSQSAVQTQSCYPKVDMRLRVTRELNELMTEKLNAQAEQRIQRCIERFREKYADEDERTLERGGRVYHQMDVAKECQ